MRSWNAHYKAVTALAFSPCGGFLASGGADGVIHAWDVGSLVDIAEAGDVSRPPAAHVTWTNHALPVTSLRFGPGIGLSAKLVSSSTDRSARVWDVASGACLLKATAPAPVTVALLDRQEQRLLMGCGDGGVYEIDVQAAAAASAAPSAQLARRSALGGFGLLGGAAVGDGLLGDGQASSGGGAGSRQCYAGHTGAISDMTLTADGGTLFTGSEDGTLRVWDTSSKQQVGALEGHKGAISALLLLDGPVPPLAGANVKPSQLMTGLAPLAPLRKHAIPLPPDWRGSGTGPVDAEVVMRLAPSVLSLPGSGGSGGDSELEAADRAFQHAVGLLLGAGPSPPPAAPLAPSDGASASAAAAGDEDVAALKARIAALEGENARWKAVNNKLLTKLQGGKA